MPIISVPMKVKARFNNTLPPSRLTDPETPLDKLFVVYHMGVPDIGAAAWQLSIDGLVERPLLLSLAALSELPQHEVNACHECAGSPLRPTVPVRRVGNVVWRGVRLKTVLQAAGIKAGAAYVWARGADGGVYPPTGVHSECYLKDLPIDKALSDEVLLATHANQQALDPDHGAPVRLVVPGYYGTNSVKWLTEIRLERSRPDAYFTTTLYNDRIEQDGVVRSVPVRALAPNAIIVSPSADAPIARSPTQIWGWAWGAEEIASVELSVDGGQHWHHAQLARRNGFSWQRFCWEWLPGAAGEHELACRATDVSGLCQPDSGARNEIFRTRVQVRDEAHHAGE